MKILVIRLSAMGDVALTVSVIKAMSEKYSDTEIF
ncbi:MAG: glycosyltransferase family 9 protein, partial [Chlorobi bacterium]|nr:glycosyltransferase family 9 protein [Chlorobiota bacterium]